MLVQGKKEYTPPPWDPSFLGLSPDPEVTEQKTLWCIPFFWENKGKGYTLFKLSAYKTGVSMRLFKLQALSLFKLPFAISGENRSLNERLRPNFGLK